MSGDTGSFLSIVRMLAARMLPAVVIFLAWNITSRGFDPSWQGVLLLVFLGVLLAMSALAWFGVWSGKPIAPTVPRGFWGSAWSWSIRIVPFAVAIPVLGAVAYRQPPGVPLVIGLSVATASVLLLAILSTDSRKGR